MKRRKFIGTAAGAAFTAMPGVLPGAPERGGIVDTNVYLGRWPFRRLPRDAPGALAEELRATGVTAAWAGMFEGLFHRDLDAVNARLVEACGEEKLFVAVGAVNPLLPGWRETLKRCREIFGMRAIRLHPNYHGYALDDGAMAALLNEARELGVLVQIAIRMEDTRTQHPRAAVPDVPVQPLLASLTKAPGVKVQLLNAMRTVRDPLLLQRLGKYGAGVEIAMLEGIEGVRNFIDGGSGVGLAYGSYSPFFYAQSAKLKIAESELSAAESEALRSGTAEGLLG